MPDDALGVHAGPMTETPPEDSAPPADARSPRRPRSRERLARRVASARRRLEKRYLVAVGVVLAAIIVRSSLLSSGTLYGESAAKISGWVVGAIAVAAGSVALRPHLRGAAEHRLSLASGALASAAAVFALVAAVSPPNTPHEASSPACRGASVAGGKFYASVPPRGANARSGPDESFSQVKRFAGNCTLAFDGYCIGFPEPDAQMAGIPDQRWLILHQPYSSAPWSLLPGDPPTHFVASAVVQSDSEESRLGTQPDPRCKAAGGWTAPGRLSLSVKKHRSSITIAARASHAILVGFAEYVPKDPDRQVARRMVGQYRPEDAAGNKMIRLTLTPSRGTRAVAASVCLAGNVEDQSNLRIAPVDGRSGGSPAEVLSEKTRQRLATAACSTQ